MDQKYNPEQLLREGKTIQFAPNGFSMYPFINPHKHTQVIVEPSAVSKVQYKRSDVLLYRREGTIGEKDAQGFDQGILVLHRVWKVKNGQYYMVGDNQKEVEGPIRSEQILGKMTAIVTAQSTCPVTDKKYLLKSRIWLLLRPFRPIISNVVARAKKR